MGNDKFGGRDLLTHQSEQYWASADTPSATVFRRWTRAPLVMKARFSGASRKVSSFERPFRAGESRFVIGHGLWDLRQRFGVWRLASAMESFAVWLKAEASLHTPKRFAQIRPLISQMAVSGLDEQSFLSFPRRPALEEPL